MASEITVSLFSRQPNQPLKTKSSTRQKRRKKLSKTVIWMFDYINVTNTDSLTLSDLRDQLAMASFYFFSLYFSAAAAETSLHQIKSLHIPIGKDLTLSHYA